MKLPTFLTLPLAAAAALSGPALAAELDPADLREKAAAALEHLLAGELPPPAPCTYCEGTCSEACQEKTAAWRAEMATNLPAFWAKEVTGQVEVYSAIRPAVLERFDSADGGQRQVLLDFVCHLPRVDEPWLEEKLPALDPKAFGLDHVLAFANRGASSCDRRLEKLAQKGNTDGDADVRPAVHAAFAGKDVGRATLERVAGPALPRGAAPALLAAVGLESLGAAERLTEVRAAVCEAALVALDEGDLARARRLVAETEYFRQVHEKMKSEAGAKKAASDKGHKPWAQPLPLALFGGEMEAWCEARTAELTSSERVFRAIESVSPL